MKRMKNEEVVKSFFRQVPARSHNGNLWTDGNILVNYRTCLGEWDLNKVHINWTKYSVTTSKIQHYILNALDTCTAEIIIHPDVPIGSLYLIEGELEKWNARVRKIIGMFDAVRCGLLSFIQRRREIHDELIEGPWTDERYNYYLRAAKRLCEEFAQWDARDKYYSRAKQQPRSFCLF